jgi:hypothetical protein
MELIEQTVQYLKDISLEGVSFLILILVLVILLLFLLLPVKRS